MKVAYRRGLHELGDELYAYLQPDGGWGWSNAGLIRGDGVSLLVDTLFDLRLTRAMLEEMEPVTGGAPIGQAVNTHGNGDHWFGNQLLPDGIPIIATSRALEDMQATPPSLMEALLGAQGLPAELEAFIHRVFGPFDFTAIEPRFPTESFDGRRGLTIGGRPAELIELGPAHTSGDAILHLPDAGVAFTGDLLFIEATPIMWAGPASNWLEACDHILELDARILVPGHGPVTDQSGVRDVQRYLRYVRDQATQRFQAGMTAEAAADDIDLTDFRDWGDPERIVVNVATIYRELDPSLSPISPPELFAQMGHWSARHSG
jgi:glyoxylase-like metal-dependent hydrolase (beta-lactamase superfamily II)